MENILGRKTNSQEWAVCLQNGKERPRRDKTFIPHSFQLRLVMESGRSERKVARDTLCVTLTYQPRILELFSRLHALLTGRLGHG